MFSKTKTQTQNKPGWRWEHFSEDEMRCKCGCGEAKMHPEFMDKLEKLREEVGVPLKVTSGYRCSKHNKAVSSSGKFGPHTTGKAADIQIQGLNAYRVLYHATRLGFTGIGVSQKGLHKSRFLHIDMLQHSKSRPRPTIWSY